MSGVFFPFVFSLICISSMSGVHRGGAAESDRDTLRPHLPAEEQVPGDHRLL